MDVNVGIMVQNPSHSWGWYLKKFENDNELGNIAFASRGIEAEIGEDGRQILLFNKMDQK